MSTRRLRSCTTCKRKHYAPSGAKCPYQQGESIPPDLLPGQEVDGHGQELSDSDPFTEDEDDQPPIRSPSVGSYTGSEFELPPGQPDPLPSTSTDDPQGPRSLRTFATATSDRVQQLEQERAQMIATQESLQAQQRALQQELEAIRQQWQPGPLQPTADVRTGTSTARLYPALPTTDGEQPRSQPTTPVTMPGSVSSQQDTTVRQPSDLLPTTQPSGTSRHGQDSQISITEQPSTIRWQYYPRTNPSNTARGPVPSTHHHRHSHSRSIRRSTHLTT